MANSSERNSEPIKPNPACFNSSKLARSTLIRSLSLPLLTSCRFIENSSPASTCRVETSIILNSTLPYVAISKDPVMESFSLGSGSLNGIEFHSVTVAKISNS